MSDTDDLIELLSDYVSEHKQSLIQEILALRTRHITVVLEDIYQPHNASACLRSCECLGVQDVHIVENDYRYRPNNDVAMGSSKWLSLHRYSTTSDCLERLRETDYLLVATSPARDGHDPLSLPLDRPVALLFGTEEEGLTDEALSAADATLRLPMFGFTQSYNISVTVALALSRLIERLRESDIPHGLGEHEKKELTLEFYRRVVRRHDLIEKAFREGR